MAKAPGFSCLGRDYSCHLDNSLDPDVAGIGVIVAFFATALFVFAAILIGYITGSLPNITTNKLDELCITKLRGPFGYNPSQTSVDHAGKEIMSPREEAFERFILALSDQQLATGLAVLIAALLKCDISVYSFGVVTGVAWFSCTTHLSTLVVLRRHLLAHSVVRKIRISGMLLVACLLLAAEVISDVAIFRGSPKNLANYCAMHPQEEVLDSFNSVLVLVNILPIVIWLISAYINRLAALYIKTDTDRSRSWVYHYLILKIRPHQKPLSPVNDRTEAIERIRKINDSRSGPALKYFKNCFELLRFAYLEMINSFLWELMWLSFGLFYGISQITILWLRRDSTGDTPADNGVGNSVTAMGVGQMIPLMLLALPILSGLEALYDVKDQPKTSPQLSGEEARTARAQNPIPGLQLDSAIASATSFSAIAPRTSARAGEVSRRDSGIVEGMTTEGPEINPSEGESSANNTSTNPTAVLNRSTTLTSGRGSYSNFRRGRTGSLAENISDLAGHLANMPIMARGVIRDHERYAERRNPIRTSTIELSRMEEASTHQRTLQDSTGQSLMQRPQRYIQRGNRILYLLTTLESNENDFYLISGFLFILSAVIFVHMLVLIFFALDFAGIFVLLAAEGVWVGFVSGFLSIFIPLLVFFPQVVLVIADFNTIIEAWEAQA